MRLIRDLRELEEPWAASAITIGNFDGVHLAHRQLLRRVVETARERGAAAVAVTFEPHPLSVLRPERAPALLTSLDRKARLIAALGIDLLVVLTFDEKLIHLTPRRFVREILVDRLHAVSVHVGPNFRFGYKHAGNVARLEELGSSLGFRVEVVPMIEVRGEPVSSSRIRELLAAGRVNMAGRLLGRPYSVRGPIVTGLGIGKHQTVPTLNLAPVLEQLPKLGVYVTRTRSGDGAHDSVTNVGRKPTFGEHRVTVECFLLNFSGHLHEAEMEVEFLHRLRDEVRFPDASALKAQIESDAQGAQKYFRRLELAVQSRLAGSTAAKA